jgi:hypothetical protein
MFERMKAGWRLARSVRRSVSRDRGIYLYPVISGLVSVIVFAATIIALFISVPSSSPYLYFIYFIGLFIAYALVWFLSTLLVLSMLISYRSFNSGSPVSIRTAFAKTWSYRLVAFEWGLFYGVLMMILRIIESRIKGIGGIIFGAIGGFIIAAATFFAVPAMLDYRSGPIKAVEQGVYVIRRNFGQTFGGVAYIDLYTLIFTLSGAGLFILGIIPIGSSPGVIIPPVLIAAGVILLMVGLILNFTYMNILKLVLFDYANGKGLPEGFNEQEIDLAIKRRGAGGMALRNLINNGG